MPSRGVGLFPRRAYDFCSSLRVVYVPTSSGEQMERFKKAASAKQLRRVSSLDLPACVVVKSGDAADAGEVLQV